MFLNYHNKFKKFNVIIISHIKTFIFIFFLIFNFIFNFYNFILLWKKFRELIRKQLFVQLFKTLFNDLMILSDDLMIISAVISKSAVEKNSFADETLTRYN